VLEVPLQRLGVPEHHACLLPCHLLLPLERLASAPGLALAAQMREDVTFLWVGKVHADRLPVTADDFGQVRRPSIGRE